MYIESSQETKGCGDVELSDEANDVCEVPSSADDTLLRRHLCEVSSSADDAPCRGKGAWEEDPIEQAISVSLAERDKLRKEEKAARKVAEKKATHEGKYEEGEASAAHTPTRRTKKEVLPP